MDTLMTAQVGGKHDMHALDAMGSSASTGEFSKVLAGGILLSALVACACGGSSGTVGSGSRSAPSGSETSTVLGVDATGIEEDTGPDAAEEPEDSRPPPLTHPEPFAYLPVEGFGDAVVSLPIATRDRRPIVVAAHGNYDTPEWQCFIWRDIVGDAAFVLCPRGVPRRDSPSPNDLRYEYVSSQRLEKEIDAGLRSLGVAFADYVDAGAVLFTGFSQGAIMGAAMMARQPDRYPRGVLIEGGQKQWYASTARAFANGGGQRVLFACGQWDCNTQSTEASRVLGRYGVGVRVVFGKGEGHSYGGAVAVEIAREFGWVVEGDERWAGWGAE